MKTDQALTQERFNELLGWLDSDQEVAGQKYEEIRRSLVKIFAWRKCSDPEGMADAAINIVAHKAPQLRHTYEGKPQLYFYGVARNLVREYERKAVLVAFEDGDLKNSQIIDDTDDEVEQVDACLKQCLEELAPTDRELALAYYLKDGPAKIDLRRQLAKDLGINTSRLRVKMFRMRGLLAGCIKLCLKSTYAK